MKTFNFSRILKNNFACMQIVFLSVIRGHTAKLQKKSPVTDIYIVYF